MQRIGAWRRRLAVAALVTTTVTILGGATPSPASALTIAVSTPDLASLVDRLGGDRVDVIRLLGTGVQDPHFLDAQPGLVVDLNRADLLIYTGLELEVGWLSGLVQASANPRIQAGQPGHLNASAAVERLLEVGQGSVSREMGDVHPNGNPHYMLDPRNARRVARVIAGRLIELDPQGADTYTANLRSFLIELDQAIARWEAEMAPQRGARIITYHRTWSYLADWLGLQVVGELEPLPGIAPNPAHLAELVLRHEGGNVDAIIVEPWSSASTAREVGLQIDAAVVVLPVQPGGVPNSDSYIDMMEQLITRLDEALQT
jgi:zinc/manganese transport system substrate-binding protein